jgi:site-specific recombinase XerD
MKSPDYKIDRTKILDRDERSMLLKTCKDRAELDLLHGRETWPKRYMLIDLALFSGLRVAEMAALRIGDLNLKAKDPYLVVQNGKGGKRRDVYLDKVLTKHLRDFITQKKQSWGEPTEPDAPLFPGRDGKQCATITLMKSFKRAIHEAGLPEHYSIHCARHTYATFLLNDTKNLRYVQKQLGHSQINMTALYADVLPSENGNLANMIVRN